MITEFKLDEIEVTKAKEFIDNHKHPDVSKGTIGGHISYIFTPTGVGIGKAIRCGICDNIRNITNYNNW